LIIFIKIYVSWALMFSLVYKSCGLKKNEKKNDMCNLCYMNHKYVVVPHGICDYFVYRLNI
jgi:hypothetical protein